MEKQEEIAPNTEDLDLEAVVARSQLAKALQTLYKRAGKPSYREIERRARRDGRALSKSKVPHVLSEDAPVRKEALVAFVQACGVPSQQLEPWVRAWERTDASDPVPPESEPSMDDLRDQMLEDAQQQAKEIVEQAHDRAAWVRVRAQEEASKLSKRKQQEAEELLARAQREAAAVRTEAKQAAAALHDQVQAEAEEQAQEILKSAHAEAMQRGHLLIQQAERDAKGLVEKLIENVRTGALRLAAEAEPSLSRELSDTDHMDVAARVLVLAQATADEAIADAQAEANTLVGRARVEAQSIIEQARMTRKHTSLEPGQQ